MTGGGGPRNEKCEGSCAAAYCWAGVSLGGGSFEPSLGLVTGLVTAGPENEKCEGSCAAANSCTGVVLRGGATISVGLTGLVTGGPENE